MNGVSIVLAKCPVHGRLEFVRCEPCSWWHCPECSEGDDPYVIKDKDCTPDGADVTQWQGRGYCPPPHQKEK